MPSTCTQCSGPHSSAQCSSDLSAVYKEIVDSIHDHNPLPDSNKNYTWDDAHDAQSKRNLSPPTFKEMMKWFNEPSIVDSFKQQYNRVWDMKARKDILLFQEAALNLKKIQFQIDHLEALRTSQTEKANIVLDRLGWTGFSGQNYKLVKELRKVDSKLPPHKPDPDVSSSAQFSPYNKHPTLAQRLTTPPRGSSSNPITIDIFTIKQPRGFQQAMESIHKDTCTIIPQHKKPPHVNKKAVWFSSTHSTIPTMSSTPCSTLSTPQPHLRSIPKQQKGKTACLSLAELTRQGLCFKWEESGHWYTNCPLYICKHCRQPAPGHRADDCPILQDTSEAASNDWDDHKDYSRWDAEYDNDLFGNDGYANIMGEPNWGWRKSGEISGIIWG